MENNLDILLEMKNETCFLAEQDKNLLWHKISGHLNFDNLVKISCKKAIRDITKIIKTFNTICKQCQLGKKTRSTFKANKYSTSKSLELVHLDLCGPTMTKGHQGERYCMLFMMTTLE